MHRSDLPEYPTLKDEVAREELPQHRIKWTAVKCSAPDSSLQSLVDSFALASHDEKHVTQLAELEQAEEMTERLKVRVDKDVETIKKSLEMHRELAAA
jgi:hypothetical protein